MCSPNCFCGRTGPDGRKWDAQKKRPTPREWLLRGRTLFSSYFDNQISLLLGRRGRSLVAGTGVRRTMALHPLLPLGLHVVPLLLLGRVEDPANLRVGAFADVHHFGAAIVAGNRSVLAKAFHLGMFRSESILHFGLLIGSEAEFLGQLRRALCRVGWAVVPAAI